MLDLIVVGAGPCGIAAGLAAQRGGLSTLILEKGSLVNSIQNFPADMTFFSTPELLEINDVPFLCSGEKPGRHDALNYYRKLADHFKLPVKPYTRVLEICPQPQGFSLKTEVGPYRSKFVALATGYFDNPNPLNVPGEDSPQVSHYYTQGHPYWKQDVLVVGGANSAVEAALDLYRHGAKVTLLHRGPDLGANIKPWILPDIRNRLKDGQIKGIFNCRLLAIRPGEVSVETSDGPATLSASFVFALIGFRPDESLMRRAGVALDQETGAPVLDPKTMETSVPGLFAAGTLAAGSDANKIFIENGRLHGEKIAAALLTRIG